MRHFGASSTSIYCENRERLDDIETITEIQSQRSSSDVGFHASTQGTQAGARVHRIHTGHCGGLDFVTAVQKLTGSCLQKYFPAAVCVWARAVVKSYVHLASLPACEQ